MIKRFRKYGPDKQQQLQQQQQQSRADGQIERRTGGQADKVIRV